MKPRSIILAALWFLSQFRSIDVLAAALGLVGGIYLLWVAAKMFRVRDISLSAKLRSQGSLATAVKVNLLNPGPYLFWFTVGGSYILRGTAFESAVFVATSIGALIAAKIAMAVLASRFLPAFESRGYLLAMKFLAATMAGFGLLSIARAAELGLSGALDF